MRHIDLVAGFASWSDLADNGVPIDRVSSEIDHGREPDFSDCRDAGTAPAGNYLCRIRGAISNSPQPIDSYGHSANPPDACAEFTLFDQSAAIECVASDL